LIDALKIALPEIHVYPVVLNNNVLGITGKYIINYFNMDDKMDIVKENIKCHLYFSLFLRVKKRHF
jgi:hypothetical protein